MIFMEHLKKQEHLESNTDRLEKLSKMDNSYVRYPMQDVMQGSLIPSEKKLSQKTASAMNFQIDTNNRQLFS